MRTISSAVEEVISRSPFYAEAMQEDIANMTGIARRIQPDVEKRLMEEVSEQSIVMALHRLHKRMKQSPYPGMLLKRLHDITVRSNLVAFISPNSSDLLAVLETTSKSAKKQRDTFVNFSRGLHESMLIVNHEFESGVSKALAKEKHVRKMTGLSAITMRLPEESLSVPGMYYPVLKALAHEGISFVEVMSVRTEFSVLFEDKDVDRAFSIIKRITS